MGLFPPTLPLDGLRTRILIVNGVVSSEEASAVTVTEHGFEIPKKPRLGACPIGTIIKDCIDRFPNLHRAQASFVSLVPWLLPKNYVLLVDTSALSKRRRSRSANPEIFPFSPSPLPSEREIVLLNQQFEATAKTSVKSTPN